MTFRIHARSFSVGVTVCALPLSLSLSLYETIKFLRPFPQQARWRAAIAACRRQNVSSVPNVPLQHSPEHLGTGVSWSNGAARSEFARLLMLKFEA